MTEKWKKGLAMLITVITIVTGSTMPSLAATSGWKHNQDKWQYENSDGSYVKQGWFQDNRNEEGLWYHFDQTGAMQTGWVLDGSFWYYLNHKTRGCEGYMRTGWIMDDSIWYYLNPVSDGTRGSMQTGWILDDGTWYFADSSGAMKTGLVKVDGKVYYLNPVSDGTKGSMKTGNVVIDGKTYTFEASGAAYGTVPTVYNSYDGRGNLIRNRNRSSSSGSGSGSSSGRTNQPTFEALKHKRVQAFYHTATATAAEPMPVAAATLTDATINVTFPGDIGENVGAVAIDLGTDILGTDFSDTKNKFGLRITGHEKIKNGKLPVYYTKNGEDWGEIGTAIEEGKGHPGFMAAVMTEGYTVGGSKNIGGWLVIYLDQNEPPFRLYITSASGKEYYVDVVVKIAEE